MFTSKRNSQYNPPYRVTYYHQQPLQHGRRRLAKISKIAIVVALIGGVTIVGPRILHLDSRARAAANQLNESQLSQKLSSIIAANPQVTVGVSLINIDTGEQFNFGSTQAVTAASTTKLISATDYLHQVELGKYSLNDNLGAGTSGWQLKELINQSDDDSWQAFENLLGPNQIQSYAQQIGISSFDYGPNSITPADEATLLQKLYQGQLLNPSHTQLLLSYMQNTNNDSLIPPALPDSATVYHKYGELLDNTGNYVNDAAIIISNGHTYILTIYTDRTDELDITTRNNIIHYITQDVVDYENNL